MDLTSTQGIAIAAAVAMLGYYYWPQLKPVVKRLWPAKGESPAGSRIDAMKALEEAERIAEQLQCPEAVKYIHQAGMALWVDERTFQDGPLRPAPKRTTQSYG